MIFEGPDKIRHEIIDVTNDDFGKDIDFELLGTIQHAPAWLTTAERLQLFTFIFCLRPKRYLEIGVLYGGASLIVSKAMDAAKYSGRLVLVDVEPQIDEATWEQLEQRSDLVVGWSPSVLGDAAAKAGGKFDFVFIDSGWQTNAVLRDANGVYQHLEDGAYVLFRNGFREEVSRAIDQFTRIHSLSIIDFGLLTREFTRSDKTEADGSRRIGCGFRLVQYRRRHGWRQPTRIIRGFLNRIEFILRETYLHWYYLIRRVLRKIKDLIR